jgi:hypothetical protein
VAVPARPAAPLAADHRIDRPPYLRPGRAPRLAAALAAAVLTGAAGQQLGTARLADWREEASTLALHDRLGEADGCATYPVPGWAAVFLRAAARFTRLAPAPGAPLLIQMEEHTHLLQLAEDAHLRPPQDAGSQPRDSACDRGIEWFYRELKEAGWDAVTEPAARSSLRPGRQRRIRQKPADSLPREANG